VAKISISGQSLPAGDYQPNSTILLEVLESFGHQITFESDGDVFLAFEHSPKGLKKFLKTSNKNAKKILIRQETDSVYPLQYTKRITNRYDLVLTFGQVTNNNSKNEFFGHCYKPYPNPSTCNNGTSFLEVFDSRTKQNVFEYESWVNRRYLITFIGGNKVGLGKSRNYDFRSKKIKQLLKQGLVVYGEFWDYDIWNRLSNRARTLVWGIRTNQVANTFGIFKGIFDRYPGAMGTVEDKSDALLQSKFTLIIENSNNFVTEKIFDAMLAGSIPIYYGPRLTHLGISDELVIRFESLGPEISTELSKITNEEIFDRLCMIFSFLSSEEFRENWLAEKIFERVADRINTLILIDPIDN
jgi:hypothetical protein